MTGNTHSPHSPQWLVHWWPRSPITSKYRHALDTFSSWWWTSWATPELRNWGWTEWVTSDCVYRDTCFVRQSTGGNPKCRTDILLFLPLMSLFQFGLCWLLTNISLCHNRMYLKPGDNFYVNRSKQQSGLRLSTAGMSTSPRPPRDIYIREVQQWSHENIVIMWLIITRLTTCPVCYCCPCIVKWLRWCWWW